MRTNFALNSHGNTIVTLTYFHLPVQTGTERNDCVSFHFSYHLFSRFIFWNGRVLFEAFLSERNLSASHFSEQCGTITFPCERDLRVL